ncbi:hypothetical protein R3P38DRAFT_3261864 [Favolaschia claudopus]|uniref:Uncharacterized protein n=1 Tax=Favolaschia claudopus TaxID=2862362 RepID=A0AAW0CKI6_9AGAR
MAPAASSNLNSVEKKTKKTLRAPSKSSVAPVSSKAASSSQTVADASLKRKRVRRILFFPSHAHSTPQTDKTTSSQPLQENRVPPQKKSRGAGPAVHEDVVFFAESPSGLVSKEDANLGADLDRDSVAAGVLGNVDADDDDDDAYNEIQTEDLSLTDVSSQGSRRGRPDSQTAANLVLRLWTVQLQDLVNWSADLRKIFDPCHVPPLSVCEILLQIHEIGAVHEHLYSSSYVPTLISSLSPRTQNFMLGIAGGDISVSVAEGDRTEALVKSEQKEVRPHSGTFAYVRVLRPKADGEECGPVACLWRYIRQYPADAAWGFAGLLARDESAASIAQAIPAIIPHLDVDDQTSVQFLALLERLKIEIMPIYGHPVYFGITDKTTPQGRVDQDLDAMWRRYTNFTKLNADFLEVLPFYLPDLHAPKSTGMRTDKKISDIELVLTQTSAGLGLNHAPGGYISRFKPSDQILAIIGMLNPSASPLFGLASAFESSATVETFLADQKHYLCTHIHARQITDTSYEHLLNNGPRVFRNLDLCVPGLRLIDAISLEDFESKRGTESVGGIWSDSTGRGLKSFRHIASIIHDELKQQHGDLSPDLIARYLGPTFNLWPLSTQYLAFWQHCLWTSRILVKTGAIVVSTWSEVVRAVIAGGYLSQAWSYLSQEDRAAVLAGHTPADLGHKLPQTSSSPPRTPPQEYLKSIGLFHIVQAGPDETDLILMVANLHAGGVKQDAAKAYWAFQLILLGELAYHIALIEVEQMFREGIRLRRQSSYETWTCFELLKTRTEARAAAVGLTDVLEKAKDEYEALCWASGHLRQLHSTRRSPTNRKTDFRIEGVTHTVGAANSQQRIAQFQSLRADHNRRARGGLNPDPFSLVPYAHREDAFGSSMQAWFLSLNSDTRISNSARTGGRNEVAIANSRRTREDFANNHEAHSRGGHAATAVLREKKQEREQDKAMLGTVVRILADWKNNTRQVNPTTGNYKGGEGCRGGPCEECGALVIADTQNSKHQCPGKQAVHVRNGVFSKVRPWRYTHDALKDPDIASLFERELPNFAVNLVKVSVQEILSRPENAQLVSEELGGLDPVAVKDLYIYRRSEEEDRDWWEATLAVDAAFEAVSRCPKEGWPTTMANRCNAWGHGGGDDTWLRADQYWIKCKHGYLGFCIPRSEVFAHACQYTESIKRARYPNTATSNLPKGKGSPHDCESSRDGAFIVKHKIKSYRDLPPEFLRARWFKKRVLPRLNFNGATSAKRGGGKSKK